MPLPLPPLKIPDQKRLSFIPSPKVRPKPASDGKPTVTYIIQLEAEFSPYTGEGLWKYIQYPRVVKFENYDQFERFCREQLPEIEEIYFTELMNYLHNFKVLNLDTRNGEVYPAHLEKDAPSYSERDNGVVIPIPGAPGPWLS